MGFPIIYEAARPPFAQRHPALASLFSGFVAFLATPVLIAVNVVVTPFLMGAAFFSQACGSGELAKYIGGSAIAKALWGEVADLMARGRAPSGMLAMLAFIPGAGPAAVALYGADRLHSRMLCLLKNIQSDEDLKIQKDINDAPELKDIVGLWFDALPERERPDIKMEQWLAWTTDDLNISWTRPLAAVLDKLYDGARKSNNGEIPSEFAARMGRVLNFIQGNPGPFIGTLSTWAKSLLGSCTDRPVTGFMELELLVEAYQILAGMKIKEGEEGSKTLQDMLDFVVKRLTFDNLLHKLTLAMECPYPDKPQSVNKDSIESALHAWKYISTNTEMKKLLDIPAVPYIVHGNNVPEAQTIIISEAVVKFVAGHTKEKDVILEFLNRDVSPVPWDEAVAVWRPNEIPSDVKAVALDAQKAALKEPDVAANHPDYIEYLRKVFCIEAERKSLQEINIEFDDVQKRWLVA